VTFQGDGNLVVYKDDDHRALWASDTLGNGGTKLIIQGDGNPGSPTATNHSIYTRRSSHE